MGLFLLGGGGIPLQETSAISIMHVTWGMETKVVDGEAGDTDFHIQQAPPVGISSHLSVPQSFHTEGGGNKTCLISWHACVRAKSLQLSPTL